MVSRRHLIVLALLLLTPFVGVGAAGAHAARRPDHARRHHRNPKAALASMGGQPRPSLFGINTDLYDSSHSKFVRDFPIAHQLGARWDRFTAGPQTAVGKYSGLDWEVRQARGWGMGVILSLGGIQSACSVRPLPSNIEACPPTTAGDLAVYQAYLRRLIIHYRNVVQYYESWIEPNNHANWIGGPNPTAYAELLSAQDEVVQSVNRQYGLDIKLLFGSPIGFSVIPGTRGWTAVLPWTQEVLDALHGQRPFDGAALLAYRFPPAGYGPEQRAWDYVGGVPLARFSTGPFPQLGCETSPWCQMNWPQELASYEQLFEDDGYGEQPLWLTEFGWPGNVKANGGYYPSDARQTEYLREAYTDLLQLPFVQAAFWFNVRDYQPGYKSPDPAFFYHYGLLQYDLSPKPAAAAFEALAKANPGR